MDIRIEACDKAIYEKTRANWDSIAKPIDGLGDFEKIICRIASIQRTEKPDIGQRALIIMCADNGIVEEGVTQTDQSVTKAVTELMTHDLSSVGIMAKGFNVDAFVVDIGVNSECIANTINKKVAYGTRNFLKVPAMTKDECQKAIQAGIDVVTDCVKKGYRIIATGEMGIGNTTTSTALLCAFTSCNAENVTGTGAGLSAKGLERKIQVIKEGLNKYGLVDITKTNATIDPDTVLYALSCVGGLDIAGLAGVYIGGAINHVPVVIDGFISAVAAVTAELICPGVKEYMIASHSGRESGTELALNALGIKPTIYADMALGEGTGAIMMLPLLDMALNLYLSGTGFADTKISSYERYDKK